MQRIFTCVWMANPFRIVLTISHFSRWKSNVPIHLHLRKLWFNLICQQLSFIRVYVDQTSKKQILQSFVIEVQILFNFSLLYSFNSPIYTERDYIHIPTHICKQNVLLEQSIMLYGNRLITFAYYFHKADFSLPVFCKLLDFEFK